MQKQLVKEMKKGNSKLTLNDGSFVQDNVMEDIEDTLKQTYKKDLDKSIYREIDDIVNDIHGKEKDLKYQMEADKDLLSSTNKSLMDSFSPDLKVKKGEKQDKYRKYRPSENFKENDLYQEMGSLMDESLHTSGRFSGNNPQGYFKFS